MSLFVAQTLKNIKCNSCEIVSILTAKAIMRIWITKSTTPITVNETETAI